MDDSKECSVGWLWKPLPTNISNNNNNNDCQKKVTLFIPSFVLKRSKNKYEWANINKLWLTYIFYRMEY